MGFFLSRTKAIYLEPNLSETILFETEAMQAFLHRIKAIYLELKLFYLELNLSEGFSIWNWIYASIFKVFYLELRLSKAICLELKLFCMQTILSKALLAWNRAP